MSGGKFYFLELQINFSGPGDSSDLHLNAIHAVQNLSRRDFETCILFLGAVVKPPLDLTYHIPTIRFPGTTNLIAT